MRAVLYWVARSMADLPPAIRVQVGAPPRSSTYWRILRGSGQVTAPRAQPSESRTCSLRRWRAAADMSSNLALTTNWARFWTSVMATPQCVDELIMTQQQAVMAKLALTLIDFASTIHPD